MKNVQNINNIEGLEEVVKLYQETSDERYFEFIFNIYRGVIQGRAYKTALHYGLESDDCEEVLQMSLWEAVKTFDSERGIPFSAYVGVKFTQSLTYLFKIEKRDNHYFGPHTKGNIYSKETDSQPIQHMVYTLSEDEEWDRPDLSPQADVENFIVDEDAAESLLNSIRAQAGEIEANVAVLIAYGYSKIDTARALGYSPEGINSTKAAQGNWVNRRLEKCVKPAEKHYKKLGTTIPIKLRD